MEDVQKRAVVPKKIDSRGLLSPPPVVLKGLVSIFRISFDGILANLSALGLRCNIKCYLLGNR